MLFQSCRELASQVAQLLVVRASGHLLDSEREFPLWEISNSELRSYLEIGVGGVILLGGHILELEVRCKSLQDYSSGKILLCADIEEGLGQRFKGGTSLIPPMGLGEIYKKDPKKALIFAKEYGICVGRQARLCGLNWVLAPVCDINTNPANPVINLRAWGEEPFTVSALATAFHKGLVSQGVLSCAKHFPGHGDADIDSHLELPIINHPIKRIRDLELIPFRTLIKEGVSSVMAGHLLFPKLDSQNPATFSKNILINLLRKELGFEGIVVTDALMMGAITKYCGEGEAAVLAFEAGADVLMMPRSPEVAIQSICDALLSGRVPNSRLEEALQRRNQALEKINFSSKKNKSFFFENPSLENDNENYLKNKLVFETLKSSCQKKIEKVVNGINFISIDDLPKSQILTKNAPALSIPSSSGFRSLICHPYAVSPWKDDKLNPLDIDRLGEVPIFLQIFSRGNPFVGANFQEERWNQAIQQLQRQQLLVGLAFYGSQYLFSDLTKLLDPSIPFSYSPGQMPDAQERALAMLFESRHMNNEIKDFNLTDFTD